MAEDNTNPFASFVNALQQKSGKKGVVKDADGKVSPVLKPEEAARYKNIFKIMKDVVNPGPEAEKAKLSTQEKIAEASPELAAAGGVASMGAAGLLAAAGLGGLIGKYLWDLYDEFENKLKDDWERFKKNFDFLDGNWLSSLKVFLHGINFSTKILAKGFNLIFKGFKTVGKIGLKILKFVGKPVAALMKISGVSKMGGTLGKILSKVSAKFAGTGLKALKFLPYVGSLVSFYLAYDAFKDGRYGRGTLELISGIVNLMGPVGNVASMLLDGGMLMYDLLEGDTMGEKWTSLTEGMLSAGGKLAELIAPIVEKIVDFFKDIGEWLLEVAGKFAEMVKKGLKMFLPDDWFDDYEAPTEFKANPKMYSKKQYANTNDQLAAIRERVGEEEWTKNMMGVTHQERQAWLASQGFEKNKPINQVEDGIVYQNGVATRIDGKDSVLAAKRGGPIEKMLDQNSAIQSQQLNVLKEIRDGIRALTMPGVTNDKSLTQEFFA